ncbi:MAG: DNRLRE domain-containing protein [Thermoflexales bacterium]|nr:DNRLRE domain-containing protein [Thermoflexales bacterium]
MKTQSFFATVIALSVLLANCAAPIAQVAAPRTAPQPAAQALEVGPPAAQAPAQPDPSQSQAISFQQVLTQPASSSASQARSTPGLLDSAYVSDRELGDGRRQALISSSPINYQAEDGSWQPIDARFESVPGGFVNRTNALKISAGERQAVLRLQNGKNLVGWEPQSVVLTAAGGEETVLAEVLDAGAAVTGTLSKDGRTIHYTHNWTLPGLSEELSSGPGQVEQSLVFASPPLPRAGEEGQGGGGTFLTLRATLHLLGGAGLYADGARQSDAFTTTGAVEIRDAQGQTVLALAPARAFEQARPGTGTSGRYRLAPQQEGEWQVAVDTAWAWWADPGRTYPAVLDPTMQVLQPLDAVKLINAAFCAWELHPSDDPAPCIAVGRRPDCPNATQRSLIRFNALPNLPPGYAIEKAELILTPIRGYYHVLGGTPVMATADVVVRRVTSQWDPGSVAWGNYQVDPSPVDGVRALATFAPAYGSSIYMGELWTLQAGAAGIVSDWLDGQNYGLELALADEGSCSGNTCQFIEIPHPSLWPADEMFKDKPWMWQLSSGGGIMLFITYTPPTLEDGVPYHYGNDDPPSPPTSGADFARSYHSYNLPASGSNWTAVGVKGLQRKIVGPDDVRLLKAGNLAMDIVCSGNWMCGSDLSQGTFGEPNYVIFRGDPATQGMRARVHPPNYDDPRNAELNRYVIEARSSEPFPGGLLFTANTAYTHTFTMRSTELLRAFDLTLVDDTRVWIDVSPSNWMRARAFQPIGSGFWHLKDSSQARSGAFEVKSGEGGVWGLVLDYRGDALYIPSLVSSASRQASLVDPVTVTVQVKVIACALDAIPDPQTGGCLQVTQPTVITPYHDVGPYRVYAEDGFDPNPAAPAWKTRKVQNGHAPFVGWAASGSTQSLVAVNGPIYLNEGAGTLSLSGAKGLVYLAYFDPPSTTPAMQLIWEGDFHGFPNPAQPDYGHLRIDFSYPPVYVLPLDANDATSADIKIDVQSQLAEGTATLTRQVETAPNSTETFTFLLNWWVSASAYPSNSTLAFQGGPSQASVGSLTLHFGSNWSVDLDTQHFMPPGRFTNLRNAAGRIVQPDGLGGTWLEVQSLILPLEAGLPAPGGGIAYCQGNCLDVRAPDDTLTFVNRKWKMPDVTVTGNAQTVMFSRPGQLKVFSTDQPNAVSDVGVPFSFRSFEGEVSVERRACPDSADTSPVTVIHGETRLALPGLGSDTNPSQMIAAEFYLCESSLRQVSLSFKSSPGIPVGNTGVWVDSLTGRVTLDESHTEIQLRDVHFYAGPGLVDGSATVTIDTRGLFDIQASGRVIAAVGFEGHAWVSWDPLDTGVDVGAHYSDWLTGQVYAHLWKGQGWQHKYSWLPDDDETHFAGSISARITIHEGQAFEWWWIDIPPCDITFGIAVAFGQFCSNAACTAYEWGVKGAFSVAGYDIGLYYGFSSGFDFILGSDDHVLIDQYGGSVAASVAMAAGRGPSRAPLVGGKPAAFTVLGVPDPSAPVYTRPLTVSANTGSFLVGMSWDQGAPQLTLVNPDGDEITPDNAASFGVAVSMTLGEGNAILYGTRNPAVGTWYARVSSATLETNYQMAYFANKKAPPVTLDTPAADEVFATNNISYTIQWGAPADSPLAISLYYSVTETSVLTPDQKCGGVIVEHLPITATQFEWDMSYLASGRYHVYAQVSEPQLVAPGYLTQTRPYSLSGQLPGFVTLHAPGTIKITDATPPAMPISPTLVDLGDAVQACWEPNREHDLAGYVLLYWTQDWQGSWRGRKLRVPAAVPYPPPPDRPKECVRIGGLNGGNMVDVKTSAYDASGNLSVYQDHYISHVVSFDPPALVLSPAPLTGTVKTTGTVELTHSLVLTWTPVLPLCVFPPCGRYLLYYAREAPAGPGLPGSGAANGPSPLTLVPRLGWRFMEVEGLAMGFRYHFVVQAVDAGGRLGPLSNELVLLLTDGVDANHNGVPDDWEIAHDITDLNADPDRDGLTNLEEYRLRTDPHRPDTDWDRWSDGEEYTAGSDPLHRGEISVTAVLSGVIPLPRLQVDKARLIFRAYIDGPDPAAQALWASNEGGGVLTPAFTTKTSWLSLSACRGFDPRCRSVSVDKSGLGRGRYTGYITVAGAPQSRTQASPQTVRVDLWLFEGSPQLPYSVYVPLILKDS